MELHNAQKKRYLYFLILLKASISVKEKSAIKSPLININ